jgi:hypothetical protein
VTADLTSRQRHLLTHALVMGGWLSESYVVAGHTGNDVITTQGGRVIHYASPNFEDDMYELTDRCFPALFERVVVNEGRTPIFRLTSAGYAEARDL